MSLFLKKSSLTKEKYTTLAEVEEALIAMSADATAEAPIEACVELYEGVYSLSRPMVLDANVHPGLAHMRITLRPSEGMRPVISSLKPIDVGGFVCVRDNIYKYQFERDENGKYPVFRDLYSQGKRLSIARGESFVHPFGMPNRKDAKDPCNERCFYAPRELVKRLLDFDPRPFAEITMFLEWEWCNAHIGAFDLENTREYDGKTYVGMRLLGEEQTFFVENRHGSIDIANREFFFHNHPAFLTPDTYCYNAMTGELYYCLPEGESIGGKRFSYPTLENLITLRGLRGVRLEGLTFTGTTSGFICEHMYFACQSNREKSVGDMLPHAAVLTFSMRDFSVVGCTFRELGGNALMMRDNNVRVCVRDSKFHGIGMSAIVIGNPTKAWHLPQNRNLRLEICNNHLHTIGYEYPAAGGIYVSMADGVRILHNTIEKVAYCGMNIGWGWSPVGYSRGEGLNIRDAEIAYNKIIDFMQTMRDGAAIYVLGANSRWEDAEHFNFMHDNYAEREMYRDASKRGYYLDGSSTNWEVYNNVAIGVRLPIFSQFHVPTEYTHHNYIHDIYTDYPIDMGNHAPWRDTIVEKCYCVTEGKEALLQTYPEARAIHALAGCDLDA